MAKTLRLSFCIKLKFNLTYLQPSGRQEKLTSLQKIIIKVAVFQVGKNDFAILRGLGYSEPA